MEKIIITTTKDGENIYLDMTVNGQRVIPIMTNNLSIGNKTEYTHEVTLYPVLNDGMD